MQPPNFFFNLKFKNNLLIAQNVGLDDMKTKAKQCSYIVHKLRSRGSVFLIRSNTNVHQVLDLFSTSSLGLSSPFSKPLLPKSFLIPTQQTICNESITSLTGKKSISILLLL